MRLLWGYRPKITGLGAKRLQTMLNRRSFALALAAAPLFANPAHAARAAVLSAEDQALVDRAAAYLQGLKEASGRFVQTDARGNMTRGDVYLKRPGRARFAYDPPSGMLVVADGANVSVANAQLKTFDSYPLMATPLSLFLARQIRLDRGILITEVRRAADSFTITARDGGRTAEGSISLTFSSEPVALIGWTVADAQGQTTHIQLSGFSPTSGLAPGLFVLKNPRAVRPGQAR